MMVGAVSTVTVTALDKAEVQPCAVVAETFTS